MIESDAFNGCSGLTEIHIPDSVTDIGDEAFSDCSGLTTISVPKDLYDFSLSGGVEIIER